MKFLRFPLQIKTEEIRPVALPYLPQPTPASVEINCIYDLTQYKGDNGVQEE